MRHFTKTTRANIFLIINKSLETNRKNGVLKSKNLFKQQNVSYLKQRKSNKFNLINF